MWEATLARPTVLDGVRISGKVVEVLLRDYTSRINVTDACFGHVESWS
jgi:hypothetical protein